MWKIEDHYENLASYEAFGCNEVGFKSKIRLVLSNTFKSKSLLI